MDLFFGYSEMHQGSRMNAPQPCEYGLDFLDFKLSEESYMLGIDHPFLEGILEGSVVKDCWFDTICVG